MIKLMAVIQENKDKLIEFKDKIVNTIINK